MLLLRLGLGAMNKLWSQILSTLGSCSASESAVEELPEQDSSFEILNFEPEEGKSILAEDAPGALYETDLDKNQLAMIQISSCGHVIAS